MPEAYDVIIGTGAGGGTTSFFPCIGAFNPALTSIANAMRVGEHLMEPLG